MCVWGEGWPATRAAVAVAAALGPGTRSQKRASASPAGGLEQPYLNVAVHDVPGVEVLQGRHDLSPVEPGPILSEDPLPGQVEEELQGEGLHEQQQQGQDGTTAASWQWLCGPGWVG